MRHAEPSKKKPLLHRAGCWTLAFTAALLLLGDFHYVLAQEQTEKLIRLKAVEVEERAEADSLATEVAAADTFGTLLGLPPEPGPGALLETVAFPGRGIDDPGTVRELLDLFSQETKPAAENGKGD